MLDPPEVGAADEMFTYHNILILSPNERTSISFVENVKLENESSRRTASVVRIGILDVSLISWRSFVHFRILNPKVLLIKVTDDSRSNHGFSDESSKSRTKMSPLVEL